MITISQPRIVSKGEKSYLISKITDEKRKISSDLWFSVDYEYEPYLCDDFADAFLLGLLPIAVKTEQNIIVDGAISKKLLYNVKNGVIPSLLYVLGSGKEIEIECKKNVSKKYEGVGVATGCSLGVDSMSAIYKHLENNVVDCFKLTHLTMFNSGQLGDYDLQASEENFLNTVKEIKPFADKLGLPVLAINGNLNFFYKDSGIYVMQTYVIRTIAFAMSVQKLLHYYILASGYPINKIKWDSFHAEQQESILLPMLSTENFESVLADLYASRVDKTAYIIKKPLVLNYLKVCWAEQTAFEVWRNTSFLEGKTKVNCGWCDKCLRTLLAIEVINNGNLDDCAKQFDLKKYFEHREQFIKKVFKQRGKNIYYQELFDLIIKSNYRNLPRCVVWDYNVKKMYRKVKSILGKIIILFIHPRRLYYTIKKNLLR